MRLALRAAGFAGALLLAAATLAAPAAALTISPTGAYTVTASTTTWTLPSLTRPIDCTSESLPVTFAANGAGTIAAGSLGYASCVHPPPIPATLTQTLAWIVRTALTLDARGLPVLAFTFSIPSRGLTVALANGCTFTLSGSAVHTKTGTALPMTVGPADAIAASSASFVVDSAPGVVCAAYGVLPGLSVSYTRAIGLSRTMTISG